MKKIFAIILVIALTFSVNKFLKKKYNIEIFDGKLSRKISTQIDKATDKEIETFEKECLKSQKYYYNSLNDDEKNIYIAVYSMLIDCDDSRKIKTDADTLNKIYLCVKYDNPNFYFVEHGFKYVQFDDYIELYPHYILKKDEVKKYDKIINDKIESIVAKAINLPDDYSKELYFNNYLCENCKYNMESDDELVNSIYGVFIDNSSKCEGFSGAMKMLLDRADIKNYVVTGESSGNGHMWNVVTIGNKNYYCDVTWNLSDNDTLCHLYFNVDEKNLSVTHKNITPSNNNCNSMDMNYFVKNGTYCRSFISFDAYKNVTAKMLKSGKNYVEFLFNTDADFRKAMKCKDNKREFFDFISDSVSKSGRKLKKDEISTVVIDEKRYIKIIFKEG